jgi:DNA repair ATPase RecN
MEQASKLQEHTWMQQIDQWEHDSINTVRQTAEEARNLLLKQTTGYFTEMEVKLNELTNQLRESRQEIDFIETDLQEWNQELERLKDELNKPSTITVRHDATPLVTKICVNKSGKI